MNPPIILTVSEFEARCITVRQLRQKGFSGQIGTICYQVEEKRELERLGANFVIHPLTEAGCQLARRLGSHKR